MKKTNKLKLSILDKMRLTMAIFLLSLSAILLIYIMVSSYGVADRVNECIKQGNTFDYCNTHVK